MPVAIVAALAGVDLCVTFVPAMKAEICLLGASFWNGDSGAYISDLSALAAVALPSAWNDSCALVDCAMAVCGQISWKCASPPFPATRCTERIVDEHAAESAIA